MRRRAAQLAKLHAIHKAQHTYPVSVDFDPPFTLMTHLAGSGDLQVRQPWMTPA